MPINAHPEYIEAETQYHKATNPEEKIKCLEKMISVAPSHKGGENLRANLKSRLKKLRGEIDKSKKSGKTNKIGIKKEDLQVVILGKTNSGKSSLLNLLTNANPTIAEYSFTTKQPIVAIMEHSSTQIQIIENPSIESPYYDKGLPHTADTLLLLTENIEQINYLLEETRKHPAKKIIVINKIDKLSESEKRKLSETLKSKKYNFEIISCKTKENIEELKERIFKSFDKLRIYTKEPGKEKSIKPMIMEKETTVKEAAEKIFKGFSEKIKETRIYGPSAKFLGQIVGLKHKLKDLDVIEFKTK